LKKKRSEGAIVEKREQPMNNIEIMNSNKQSVLEEWSEKDLIQEEAVEYRL
jgi:hypothetical protein